MGMGDAPDHLVQYEGLALDQRISSRCKCSSVTECGVVGGGELWWGVGLLLIWNGDGLRCTTVGVVCGVVSVS